MFDFDVRSGYDADITDVASPATFIRLPHLAPLLAQFREEFSEPIARLSTREPVIVEPSHPLGDALKQMADRHAGSALVASHGVLLGILAERDVVRRMIDVHPATEIAARLPVWKAMGPVPETLLETDTIAYAVRKQWTLGGRAMPILGASGALCGLLEIQDVLLWLCECAYASPPHRQPAFDHNS